MFYILWVLERCPRYCEKSIFVTSITKGHRNDAVREGPANCPTTTRLNQMFLGLFPFTILYNISETTEIPRLLKLRRRIRSHVKHRNEKTFIFQIFTFAYHLLNPTLPLQFPSLCLPNICWEDMAAKLGSFKYSFAEKRERLLSSKGYSVLAGFNPIGADEEEEEEGEEAANRCWCSSFRSVSARVSGSWKTVQDVAYEAWKMGLSDPRKIVFSAKMGLALMLISLLIFLKEPVKELSRYSVWAILTVVVVFEFSIGMAVLVRIFFYFFFLIGTYFVGGVLSYFFS
jgi:hypothetical protein